MNRAQIKRKRVAAEKAIDDLMSRGYGGSEDPAFKRACVECKKHEETLIVLAAAVNEINRKSTEARRKNPYVKSH